MQINTYLAFDGQCEAAFKFYEKVLGGQITGTFRYKDMPDHPTPPELADRIMHIRLVVGEGTLMGADAPPGHFSKPAGFSVSINVAEPAEAERIFAALSENGSVFMPMEETFWAHRFGMVTDQFSTPWMINCEKPM